MEDPSLTEPEPWLSRFFPKSFDDFYGYDDSIRIANEWIQCFSKDSPKKPEKNALLITGQPGTGKTAFAYTLIASHGFQLMETTALDSRTSDEVRNKLGHVLGEDSITVMTKNPKKTAVVMDEIDGSDKQECPIKDIAHYIHFAKHDYEYRWRVHMRTTKKKVSETEIKKKLRDTHFPNKNPLILIANTVTYSIRSILKDVIHIHLELPTPTQLLHTMGRIQRELQVSISPTILEAAVPYCQEDYRRAIHIMNDIWNRFYQENRSFTEKDIVDFLKSCSPKDVEIPIESVLYTIFDNSGLSIEQVYHYHQGETEYLPTLVYENYIQQLVLRNPEIPYESKLENAIEAYEWMLFGAEIRHNEFGKDEISMYPGYFTTVAPYVTMHKMENTFHPSEDTYIMDKSKISSKYKYRFCQFRPLYHISRKLRMSIHELPIMAHMVLNAFFIQTDRKSYFMELLSKLQMKYEDVEKLFRSSIYFSQTMTQLYTKKKEKDLETEYREYMKKNMGYESDDE